MVNNTLLGFLWNLSNFQSLYWWKFILRHCEILDNNHLLPNLHRFLRNVCEVSLTWFLLVPVLKEDRNPTIYKANGNHAAELPTAGQVISE